MALAASAPRLQPGPARPPPSPPLLRLQVAEGSALKRALFNWGYQRKLHFLGKGYAYDKVRCALVRLRALRWRRRDLALSCRFLDAPAPSPSPPPDPAPIHPYPNPHPYPHPSQAAPFFDKLVFSKIKARLGGRVKVVVSGAWHVGGGRGRGCVCVCLCVCVWV